MQKIIDAECPECKAKFEVEVDIPESEAKVEEKEANAAKLAEVEGELKEQSGKVAELEQELKSEEHRTAVLNEWLQGMTPEIYHELGGKLGYQVGFVKATEAEVAEAEREEKEEAGEKKPGFLDPLVAIFDKKKEK